jgi:hypothetical protein
MTRDKLCRLEIEIYNATRKFANKKNKEKKKQIHFAKMEDQAGNGTNSTIFTVDSLGDMKINGFVRAIYTYNSYDEEDWKIKIDGSSVYDKRTEKYVPHPIVGEYKECLIQEVFGINRKIE